MAERFIIAMTGLAQSGKDVVGEHLAAKHGFARDAFADDVRKALYEINPTVIATDNGAVFEMLADFVDRVGWDEARHHEQVQGLLQRTGTEGGWMIHGESLWTDRVEARMHALPKGQPLVITDCRTQHELDWVRQHGGLVFRVDRVGQEGPTGALSEHSSEQVLPGHDFLLVNNDSLASLRAQVDGVLDLARDTRRR